MVVGSIMIFRTQSQIYSTIATSNLYTWGFWIKNWRLCNPKRKL